MAEKRTESKCSCIQTNAKQKMEEAGRTRPVTTTVNRLRIRGPPRRASRERRSVNYRFECFHLKPKKSRAEQHLGIKLPPLTNCPASLPRCSPWRPRCDCLLPPSFRPPVAAMPFRNSTIPPDPRPPCPLLWHHANAGHSLHLSTGQPSRECVGFRKIRACHSLLSQV